MKLDFFRCGRVLDPTIVSFLSQIFVGFEIFFQSLGLLSLLSRGDGNG